MPFKPSGGGFGGKAKVAVEMAVVGTNFVTTIAEDDREVDAVISNVSPIKIAETLKARATNVLTSYTMKRKMDLSSAIKGINKSKERSQQ